MQKNWVELSHREGRWHRSQVVVCGGGLERDEVKMGESDEGGGRREGGGGGRRRKGGEGEEAVERRDERGGRP